MEDDPSRPGQIRFSSQRSVHVAGRLPPFGDSPHNQRLPSTTIWKKNIFLVTIHLKSKKESMVDVYATFYVGILGIKLQSPEHPPCRFLTGIEFENSWSFMTSRKNFLLTELLRKRNNFQFKGRGPLFIPLGPGCNE